MVKGSIVLCPPLSEALLPRLFVLLAGVIIVKAGRLGIGAEGFWLVVRVVDGTGERRQVITGSIEMLSLPGVGEDLRVKLGVIKVSRKPDVIEGAVHRGLKYADRGEGWNGRSGGEVRGEVGGLRVRVEGAGSEAFAWGGDWVGAIRRRGGVGADTRYDTSPPAEMRGRMSFCVTDWFAILEDRSWRSVQSSWLSFTRLDRCFVTVSSWVVMTMMPEMVAHSMESMEPSPAVMVCRAWGERL